MLIQRIAAWLGRQGRATSITDIPELSTWLGTTIGTVRNENQDRAVVARYVDPVPRRSFFCTVLCDGMGGMTEGGKCAEIAIATFIASLMRTQVRPVAERISIATRSANEAVHQRYQERGGTTIAAIVIAPDAAAGITVGDSRIYGLQGRKTPTQISSDDTLSDELQKVTGRASSTGNTDAFSGQLTQYVGMGDEMRPHMHWVRGYESFLLTSDGVHGMNSATFNDLVVSAGDARDIVTRLLSVSKWCGGRDNATAVCLSVARTDKRPEPASAGWLEIWDPFGKLDMALTREELQDLPEFSRPERNNQSWSQPTSAQPRKESLASVADDRTYVGEENPPSLDNKQAELRKTSPRRGKAGRAKNTKSTKPRGTKGNRSTVPQATLEIEIHDAHDAASVVSSTSTPDFKNGTDSTREASETTVKKSVTNDNAEKLPFGESPDAGANKPSEQTTSTDKPREQRR